MGFYLYCLLPEESEADAPCGPGTDGAAGGLEGAAVQALRVAGFRVWVSEASDPPRPTLENIRAHDAVVRAAMVAEGPTPLPMRFGQWFSGSRSLVKRLDETGPGYRAALARVQGKVELGVRIVVDPSSGPRDSPEEETAQSGREYMEHLARCRRMRQEREALGRRFAGRLRCRLGDLVQDERIRTLEPDEGLTSVAHLVAHADEGEWAQIVDRLDRESEGVAFHRTGPWPPYSFAEREET